MFGLVQECCFYLVIEIVMDVGSYFIDGFIMWDVSSYDDIIEINYEEKVFDVLIYEVLKCFVFLCKLLVQDYFSWEWGELYLLSVEVLIILEQFVEQVSIYVEKEFGLFQ